MFYGGRSPDRTDAARLAPALASDRARRPRMLFWTSLLLVLAGCVMWAMLAAAWPMSAAARSSTGTLVVAFSGLTAGQQPSAVLTGPGFRRRVTASRLTIRDARTGTWTLRLDSVKLMRSSGALRRGATAYPATLRVTVRLRSGGRARMAGRYGSIVNPGVVSVSGGVVAVGGPARNPSSVTFAGHRALRVGEVLSLRPSARLPRGLLARVLAVEPQGDRTVVRVQAVSVYSVMPVANFDVPLTATPSAAADVFHPNFLAELKCGPSGASGVYRRITNIHISGGWNTVHVFGAHVPVGVRLQVDFDAEAGLDDLEGLRIGASCELDVPVSGMAGPVPVTGAVYGNVSASADAGLLLSAGASVHVTAHATTVGTPPALLWVPGVQFSDPHITFTAKTVLQATASIGIGVKAGLGNEDVAAVTLDFGSKVEFSAQPGACSWDEQFGAFSAEGKLLGWDIETPKTPPLFTKNLWHNPCAATGSSGGSGGTGGLPSVPVSALGPTSGPRGFGLRVRTHACPSTLGVELDGQYWTNWTAVSPTLVEVLTLADPSALSAGAHQLSFICVGAWTSPGFPIDIDQGGVQDLTLESRSAPAGGSFVFDSGASDGPQPCPALPGFPLTSLSIRMLATTPTSPTVSQRAIPMPDNQTSESLPVPSSLTPGYYVVGEECLYADPSIPDGGGSFSFGGATVTITHP